MPALAAASVTTSSRIDPPGCTIAFTPASVSVSSPSGNGKNASDAADGAPHAVAAALDRQPGRVDPVDLAHAHPDGRAVGGDDDRVGLHRAAGPPRELQVGQRLRVGGLSRWPASS